MMILTVPIVLTVSIPMTLFILSFVAGMLTVLAPCILPLLPVVLAGSAADTKNRHRPLVIIVALGLSVFLFTFLLKASTLLINIPPEFWTYFSATIIAVFGLTLVFPAVWDRFVANIPGLRSGGNTLLAKGYQSKGAWWGDVAIGVALGPIFTTCSPTYFLVLATVLPVHFLEGSVYIAAYVSGLAIVLFGIATLGQRLIANLTWAVNPEGWFKRGLGILFLIIAAFIATGLDKKTETAILNAGFFDVTTVEQGLQNALTPAPPSTSGAASIRTPVQGNYAEITDPAGFVNAEPFQLKDLVGKKVIMIDFLAYSCINCQRTFPYLNRWYDLYHDQGLEIVGIHTPEFAFEHVKSNVEAAAKQFGLKFPLVLDNNYGTWNAWNNSYWPHKFLIDIHGNVVYDHVGEGAYDETEQEIVTLLNERKQVLGESGTVTLGQALPPEPDVQAFSPETYFGAMRNGSFGNGTPQTVGEADYAYPAGIRPDAFYLNGRWSIEQEYARPAAAGASFKYAFKAKNVYLVGEAPNGVHAKVLIDGKPVSAANAGADVTDGGILFKESRLYHLYTSDAAESHTLEIIFDVPDAHVYTLTFG